MAVKKKVKPITVNNFKKESSNDLNISYMNDMQKTFAQTILEKEITLCVGPAGTAKTYIACAVALQELLKGNYEKIYLIKSVTPLEGEAIGYLKGTMEEKLDPFMMSFKMNFSQLLDEKRLDGLFTNKRIEVLPLAYIRGVSISKSIIICDESQNMTRFGFRTLLTRLGQNSKMIVMGDTKQIDLKKRDTSALRDMYDILIDDRIGRVEFQREHIVRNPLIIKIEDIFETKWG